LKKYEGGKKITSQDVEEFKKGLDNIRPKKE
jgi:hypothetical protein